MGRHTAHPSEKPMFTEEDLAKAEDHIKEAFIRIFIDKKISYGKFVDLHRDYLESIGTLPRQITNSRNNIIKNIHNKNTLTFHMFEYVVKNILGLNMVGCTFKFVDSNLKPYSVDVKRQTY